MHESELFRVFQHSMSYNNNNASSQKMETLSQDVPRLLLAAFRASSVKSSSVMLLNSDRSPLTTAPIRQDTGRAKTRRRPPGDAS